MMYHLKSKKDEFNTRDCNKRQEEGFFIEIIIVFAVQMLCNMCFLPMIWFLKG